MAAPKGEPDRPIGVPSAPATPTTASGATTVPERPTPSPQRQHAPQLIAYADRFGGSLHGLIELLHGPLRDTFGGVHILPFYRPYDGADAGFDPEDHTEVDARLGAWADIRDLAQSHTVMADVIVNHVSVNSPQFRNVIGYGDASPSSGMFLTLASVFPHGATEAALVEIYRPRPGLPFTAMTLGGQRRLVWTTFTAQQVDLNIHDPSTWAYLTTIVDRLTDAGVRMLRLDAVGYVGKQAGTNCFMTYDSLRFVQQLRDYAHQRGACVLLEVHGHYQQQIELAQVVDWVYDFALPPLLLHALYARDIEPLARWLAVRPVNTVTVLDTHDGIGIVDVGASKLRPGVPGLLTKTQIDDLVESIHTNTNGTSRLATGTAANNLDLYQVNSTFYDAVGRDNHHYLLARMIQLFLPGIPQIYYVGLLAGSNDMELLQRTGIGRDVNRHHCRPNEVERELRRPVVRAQLAAIRLRAHHPAFLGDFIHHVDQTCLTLAWSDGVNSAALHINVADLSHRVTSVINGVEIVVDDLMTLADEPEPWYARTARS